jgi:hypothetical protein
MGNRLINVATTEAHPPLANALRKLGRAWHSLTDLDQAQAISECVILADSLGYQGMNARSAKETLQMRTGVLEEYQAAVKTTISKRRHIERLKASSNIRPEKVDEALADMEEVNMICVSGFISSAKCHLRLIVTSKYFQEGLKGYRRTCTVPFKPTTVMPMTISQPPSLNMQDPRLCTKDSY